MPERHAAHDHLPCCRLPRQTQCLSCIAARQVAAAARLPPSLLMIEQLLPLATYCALMSVTPGPNNVMVATSGVNFGFRRTLPHLLGIRAGIYVMTVMVCLGLGAVFAQYPEMHQAMKVLGGCYLVYLAWKLAGAQVADAVDAQKPLSFFEGAAFQLVNPKNWMVILTLATMFMPNGVPPMYGALLVATVHLIVGFPSNSVWALFGVGLRRALTSKSRLRLFNAAMGLALLVLAFSLMH